MDKRIYKIVEEECESTKRRIFTRIKRLIKDGNQASARRSMKLHFRNRISKTILTGEEIKGEGNTSIEVALVDDSTGNIVDVGPEASAGVEIVLLKGEPDASEGDDWSVEEFDENIVQEMEGKKPLLAGNIALKLQRGIGVLENIKFRHHATKKKPSVFRLGARVVDTFDGDRIKEAKTESFTIKDFRNKYYKKHETPSLSDEVSRLINIRKGGKIDKRLQDIKICTVEDFLIRLLIDPEGLKSIVNLGAKKWDVTVNNARACPSDKRIYCYINFEQKIGIVFNVLGQVLGLYLKSQYAPTNMLSENHKADAQELLASAYENWGDVKPFDDVNSLLQYFTGLSTYMDPPDSLSTDCPGGGHGNTETSVMIGESSSTRSNFSLQSISSTMNLIRETGVEDFCSFSTDDVETIYDDLLQLSRHSSFNPENMFSDFDDFLHQNGNCDRQLNSPINDSNADEQLAATAVTFVESQVVHISKPPKRWKKLFCVSRWFSIRKKVSIEDNHNRKKQKVR